MFFLLLKGYYLYTNIQIFYLPILLRCNLDIVKFIYFTCTLLWVFTVIYSSVSITTTIATQNISIIQTFSCTFFCCQSSPTTPWLCGIANLLSVTTVWPFPNCHMKGMTQCSRLCLLSLGLMCLKFMHVFASIVGLFLFCSQVVFHCMNMPHFVYPFTSGQTLGYFQVGVTMNRVAINFQSKNL